MVPCLQQELCLHPKRSRPIPEPTQPPVKLITIVLSRRVKLTIIIIIMDVSCHRTFHPGTSLEQAVIPTAQASSFTLQYFPYYV